MTAEEYLDAEDAAGPNALPAGDGSAPTVGNLIPGRGVVTARTTTYFPGERYSDPDTDAGRTATGGPLVPASPAMAGTVAVDPAKYPYGTIFRRPDGSVYVAADTGGAVKRMTASRGAADVLDFASPTRLPDWENVQVIPPQGNYTRMSPSQKADYHRQAAAFGPAPAMGSAEDFLDAPDIPAAPVAHSAAPDPMAAPDAAFVNSAPPRPAATQPRSAEDFLDEPLGALVSVPDKRPAAPPAPETPVSLGQTLGYLAGQEPAWTNNPVAAGAFDALGRAFIQAPTAATDAVLPFVSGIGENLAIGLPRAIETQAARLVDTSAPEILSPEQKHKEQGALIEELAGIRDADAHGDGPPAPPSAREQAIVARLNALPAVRENPLTEEEQAAIASRQDSAAGMRADVAAAGGVVDESRRQYEGDLKPGEKAPLSTRIQRGLADTAATMVPGVGMLSLLANTDNAARDAFLADAAKNGRDVNSPEVQREADHAGDVGMGKTGAVLPAYMLAGGVAGKAASALTPEKAGAIRAFLTSGAAHTGANVAASAGVRALEGEDPTPTLEGFLSGDLPFAVPGAFGAAGGQRARQVMARMRDEAGRTPTVREESAPVARSEPDPAPAGETTLVSPEPVSPTFAPSAAAFLEGDGSAFRVSAGKVPPAELEGAPHITTPDGERIYFDPGTHTPEDFAPTAATPDSDFAPKDEPTVPKGETKTQAAETVQPDSATGDGLDADALEAAYSRLLDAGIPADEAARRLGAVETARDADHAVEQVLQARTEEERARRQEEAERLQDADGYLKNESGGTELLDAIADAGGLPTVGHPGEAQFRGELANVRSAARGSRNFGGQGGVFTGRLFRKDAPGMDELVQRLRARGFDFTGEDDLFQAVEQRLRTGKAHFGFAEGNPDLEPRARVLTPDENLGAEMSVRKALAESPDLPRDRSVIKIARRLEDLPADVRDHPLTARAEAFYHPPTDTIYFQPHVLADPARAPQILRHELLHRGLKRRYGRDYDAILDHAASHAGADELAAVARDYNAPEGWETDAGHRRYLAEELLARRAEAGDLRQGWVRRGVSRVRELLRRVNPRVQWSNADVAAVIRRSVRAGVLGERQAMGTAGTRFARRRSNNPEQGGLFETDADRAKREEKLARIRRSLQPEPAFDLGDETRPAPKAPAPEFRDAARVEDPGDLGLRAEERGGQQALFSVRHEVDEDGNRIAVRRGLPKGHPLLKPTDAIGGVRRELQRDNWVRRVVEQGRPVPEGTRPVLYMMGGGSGSGKSTLRDRMLARGEIPREGTAILDSDEFKKQFIPEYAALVHAGDSAASTLAHRESADLLKRALSAVLDKRANAVLDGTMSHRPYAEGIIRQARAAGYDVHAIGVTVHPETALERARRRAEGEGRAVPVRDVLDRVRGFGENFDAVAPLVDRWELHDNNGPAHRPVAIREGGGLDIHDRRLYDDFQGTREFDYDAARQRFTEAARGNWVGGVDSGTAAQRGGRRAPERLASAPEREGTGGPARGHGSRAGYSETPGRGPDGRTGPVGESPRFSVKSEPSDDLVAKAKKFLSFHFGASIEALEKKSPLASPRQWVKTATELGFKPPLEQKPFVPDAFEMVDASKPEDVAKIHDKAAKGWTFKNGLATKKLVDVNGKTVAVGQTQTHAANALLGQHAWSIVPGPGQTWHVVDDLGTSLFSSTNASEAYKAGVSKLLGELAVKKHMATFHPEADATPAPYVAPPSRVPTTKAAPDTAGRTSRGRELPPGLRAPPEPANLPSDRRLEEAERQADAVPLKVNPNYGKPAAPDGSVSNLAEPQWRQVRTPLFKSFFGDWERDPANASKVLDGKGEPRVMYRGTKKGITPDMRPNGRRQIYLSESPEFSDGYGRYSWETFVNARNPWDYQNPDHLDALRRSLEADPDFLYGGGVGSKDKASPAYRERLQELRDNGKTHAASVESAMFDASRGDWLGIDRYPIWEHLQRMLDRGDHDGVWITEAGARNLIVPDARQVKSATHNEGTFDPANPDTRFSVRPDRLKPLDGLTDDQIRERARGEIAGRENRSGFVRKFVTQDVKTGLGGALKTLAGAIKEPRTLLAPANVDRAAGRTAGIIRDRAAELATKDFRARKEFEKAAKQFARLPDADNLDIIHRMERGLPQATPELQRFADNLRQAFDARVEQVRAMGTGKLEQVVENYFPHIWKDPEAAGSMYAQILGKRPLEGSKSFTKERSIPTTTEGVAAGLEPVTYNPVELALLKLHEMDRYVMGQKVFQEMRRTGQAMFFRAPREVPEGWVRINDRIADVTEVRQTTRADGSPGGKEFIPRGNYYAPDGAARVLNNYLSPGLRGKAVFDAMRGAGNLMNQAQLSLSAFHLGFVSVDSATSKTALGVEQISRGVGDALLRGRKLEGMASALRGVGNIAKGTVGNLVLYPQIENVIRGNRVLQEYAKPGAVGGELARIIDSLQAGGGRVEMDSFYHNDAIKAFTNALRSGNYIGATWRAPLAAMELSMKPILSFTVPRMKLGIFADMMAEEYRRLPANPSREQLRSVAGKAWDSVDNRMGQLVYDNLFWQKTLKDLLMVSTRSVGWNLGTIRELGGSVVDSATVLRRLRAGDPLVTHKMAYAMALPITVGTLGAMAYYLHNGQAPQDLKDYFLPRTGRKNPDGSDERLMLPSYIKDVLAYAKHPLTTVTNKIHPLISSVGQMLNNKDFYNVEIRHDGDPLLKQVADEAKFLGKSFVPFSLQGMHKRQETGPLAKAESFLGVTPAPAELARTPAMQAMHEAIVAKMSGGTKTREEADRADFRRTLMDAERHGQSVNKEIADAVRDKRLTFKQGENIRADGWTDPRYVAFKHLSLNDAERVFALGTSEEKALWKNLLMMKGTKQNRTAEIRALLSAGK